MDKPKWTKELEQKRTAKEDTSKGEAMLEVIADLYTLIDWSEDKELGDPWVKVSFYKSGKFTIENYKDGEIAEFNINSAAELE